MAARETPDEPPGHTMDAVREEFRLMFHQFQQQLFAQQSHLTRDPSPDPDQGRSLSRESESLPWSDLLEDIPLAPPLQPESWPKVLKVAKEVKRRAAMMTAG